MNEKSPNALIFTDTDNGGVIHVANIKGGVGKSTVATNLAASLSRRGPTLIIDLDVQGSATVALGQDTVQSTKSSWEFLGRRFVHDQRSSSNYLSKAFSKFFSSASIRFLQRDIKSASLTSMVVQIDSGLDLIPAGADLFKNPSHFQIENLLYNIEICRDYYKYIVIDTPSVWNPLTRALFKFSDLNLIPVTLNALSTKSLRDYLSNVKSLSEHNPSLRIRIIKNEVFGNQDSKLKGKTRTMSENRKYLDNLCEQVTIQSSSGVSLLPQSIMFDLEIPESAIVRDAQDQGIALNNFHQHAPITIAFNELAKRVQFVLNTPVQECKQKYGAILQAAPKILAAAVLIAAFISNNPVMESRAPRPVAPQQLADATGDIFSHTFKGGESIYKLAKYAICRFRATVPSTEEVNRYAMEVVTVHNNTRLAGESRIKCADAIPKGLTVTFYPPELIINPNEKQLVPVYKYFTALAGDKFAYITGDWCERGTGGGQPHYGIDIAAPFGSKIFSPIDGTVAYLTSENAGRVVGVIKDGSVLFFAHMDKRTVKDGSKVKKGDVLGTVGMTGRTSGPHIHLGYGIKAQSGSDINFGKQKFRVTDPKLFFYRQMFLSNQDDLSD